jgi:prenyltransferase beta subunit
MRAPQRSQPQASRHRHSHRATALIWALDSVTLLRWLVQVQGVTEAELGGFKGRTKKLVDGYYS